MTKEREALSMALAFIGDVNGGEWAGSVWRRKETVTAINEALAQPEQEPVAWLDPWTQNNVTTDYDAYGKHGIPLYTAPPKEQQSCDKREWVGMEWEDIQKARQRCGSMVEAMQYINDWLKEKNA